MTPQQRKANPSVPRRDEPERKEGVRAKGGEEEVAIVSPIDPRDRTEAYLRRQEGTLGHPYGETSGATRGNRKPPS